jgi:hypothetical protein
VHVVLNLRDVPRLVGDRRPLVAPAPVAGEAGELARRVGSVLGLLVLPDARETLLTTRLRPRVEAAARTLPATSALVVPPDIRDWVESAAERMRQGIKRAGYAVHGDLDALVPRWSAPAGTGVGPTPQATLDLAVRVLLDERRTA